MTPSQSVELEAAVERLEGDKVGAFAAEALALVWKHGNPNGTPYEQGQNDMGHRMVTLASRADAALSASNGSAAELDAIAAAIGTVEFMDPPDGGDVPLAEQVRRMKAAYDASNARALAAEEALREIERIADVSGQSGSLAALSGLARIVMCARTASMKEKGSD